MPKLSHVLALAAAASALATGDGAHAGTSTGQFSVNASVTSGCALNGGTLNFGEYTAGQPTDLDAVGQIDFANCAGELTFELDGGTSGSGDVSKRQMVSGTKKLGYQIYRNASRTDVWGMGPAGHKISLPAAQNGKLQLYGRIPRGLNVQPGSYADTISITLTF